METQNIFRNLARIETPPAQPGFLGAGHIARPVIHDNFKNSDPFIILMDDLLDKKDNNPVGGPHPHAGFETVSLLIEGNLGDDEHQMKTGDFQIMTAGSGIVHTETIEKKARMRLLQMWLNLPKQHRWAPPRVQDLTFENVPRRKANGSEVYVYSGSFADLVSPIKNYIPLIIADVRMEAGASLTEKLDNSYNAFLYVLDGEVTVGETQERLTSDQVGWLEQSVPKDAGELTVTAGKSGARFILYAAVPQNEEIVSHGPFIADSPEQIRDLYTDFRKGRMGHVSALPAEQKYSY